MVMKVNLVSLGVVITGTPEEIKAYADTIANTMAYIESERQESLEEEEKGNYYGSDYIWEERMPKMAANMLWDCVNSGKCVFTEAHRIPIRVIWELEDMEGCEDADCKD